MSKIPGVVWSALLVLLPLLAMWMGDSFSAYGWAAPVAGLLLIIAKTVEAVLPTRIPMLPGDVTGETAPEPESPSWSQWAWG